MKGKKTGGRKKGTPNKATKFSKDIITQILSDYTREETEKNLFSDLYELEAKDRLDIAVKLMAFVTPKPQSIDLSLSQETKEAIDDQIARLSRENDI